MQTPNFMPKITIINDYTGPLHYELVVIPSGSKTNHRNQEISQPNQKLSNFISRKKSFVDLQSVHHNYQ